MGSTLEQPLDFHCERCKNPIQVGRYNMAQYWMVAVTPCEFCIEAAVQEALNRANEAIEEKPHA